VWLGTQCDGRTDTARLQLSGSPGEIVEQTCAAALRRLVEIAESVVGS
jgi:hypothetical protein